ncbi:hypothetical protein M9Y10_003890 [Tritrichomonas musculus]|uniref:Small GTP-binding protein n=1 Tax=Tritrichomonas musculus TaxID=1915356 RepID=A0ABR2JQI4_9EUKA
MNKAFIGYKVPLIGDEGVGKTSIISRFMENKFDDGIRSTVGAANFSVAINIDGHEIPVNIWDTAGQEKYRSLIPLYTRDTSLILIVFSMDTLESFEHLPEWYQMVRDECKIDCPVFICGNKIDTDNPRVDHEVATEWANKNKCQIVFTSAKDGTNINELFHYIAEELSKQKQCFKPNEFVENADNKEEGGCC